MTRRKVVVSMLPERGCHNCIYWREQTEPGDDRTGECRRNPPAALFDPDAGLFMAWPWTSPEDFCGEHSAKLQ